MSRRPDVREHDYEPQTGLPEALPAGERLLWQGAPDWRVLARRALHLRKFAAYFGVLVGWRVVTVLADGGGAGAALVSVAWMLPLAALSLGIMALFAWLVGKTAIYSVTDRRVVMRVGIVLTVTFNLPLARIEAASLRDHGDGSGDISLLLNAQDRIGYLHLWPHTRPWRFTRTEPTLRALADVRAVAALLADALAQTAASGTVHDLERRPRPAAERDPLPTAA